jgi:hypothetical protein
VLAVAPAQGGYGKLNPLAGSRKKSAQKKLANAALDPPAFAAALVDGVD